MNPHNPHGTYDKDVGQAILDLEGIRIPLSGEVSSEDTRAGHDLRSDPHATGVSAGCSIIRSSRSRSIDRVGWP